MESGQQVDGYKEQPITPSKPRTLQKVYGAWCVVVESDYSVKLKPKQS